MATPFVCMGFYSPQLLFWNQLLLYFLSSSPFNIFRVKKEFLFQCKFEENFSLVQMSGENIKDEEKEISFQYCLLPKHFPFLSFYSIHDFIEQDFTFLIITEDDRHVDGRTKKIIRRDKQGHFYRVDGRERYPGQKWDWPIKIKGLIYDVPKNISIWISITTKIPWYSFEFSNKTCLVHPLVISMISGPVLLIFPPTKRLDWCR